MINYHVVGYLKPLLLCIDLVGNILFFWTKLSSLPKNPHSILFIRPDHIGDVLLTTPLFSAIKKRFPSAKISVLVRSSTNELLIHNKDVDEVIVLNVPWFVRGARESWLNTWLFAWSLRGNYDVVLDMHADPRNIFFAFLVGGFRIGYGVRGFGFLLNKVVKWPGFVHAIDRNLCLAAPLGINIANKSLVLQLTTRDELTAKSLITKSTKNKKLLACAPGTGRWDKEWLVERWAKLLDALIKEKSVFVVFVGGTSDERMVRDIQQKMTHSKNSFSIAGKTSLNQTAAVLKQCAFLVCTDTAAMHLARAVNTPLLGLFGTGDPFMRWGYCEKKYDSLYKVVPGIPRTKWMKHITVWEVLKKIESMGIL